MENQNKQNVDVVQETKNEIESSTKQEELVEVSNDVEETSNTKINENINNDVKEKQEVKKEQQNPNISINKDNVSGNTNLIYKHAIYIKVKEYKTNKEVIINTRRILYTIEIDKNTTLFMMNSGYKIKVAMSINDVWKNMLSKQPFKR